jgi:gliding motility-associated-like protein
LCANQTTTLNAGISSANSFTWSNGITTFSQVVAPLITTTYSVIGNSGLCLALVSAITVSVNSIVAEFNGIVSLIIQQGSVLNLVNTSTGATNYFWEFCNTSTSTLTNPIFLAKDTGNCCIKLISENLACRDSVIKCFQIANESIIIFPNVFTPNGDKVNDVFKFSNPNFKDLNCTIFDRWGLKLHQWIGVTGFWDGNVKSLPAPSGTYFYILNYTTVFGEVKTEKNFFSLFRD